MPKSLPYLASNKNVETLFSKIQAAQIPEKFTQEFLKSKIGLTGMNDRSLIPLLKNLGFVDASGTPTAVYSLLKNKETQKKAIAAGIKKAYAPLFAADEGASTLSTDKMKGLVAQVAGTDDDMTARIAATFLALTKIADFTEAASVDVEAKVDFPKSPVDPRIREYGTGSAVPEFHYNIQIHLPTNATEETYLNIFNAIRKSFQ